jgi:citrate lyase subunit beta-like protein
MHSRRALLYVPGDDRHKIEKAAGLTVDCICMDMEDGVALERKPKARAEIANALDDVDFGQSERLARINGIGTGLERDDLLAVLPHRPDGIVIPKVEDLKQIEWASELIEAAELRSGWAMNSIRILVDVETPKGVLNVKEIASHPRLDALIFGGEDFAAALGATRTPEAVELLYARQAVLTAAAANGLQAIDLVAIDFKDLSTLRLEASLGAGLGFTGKQIIHPAQVEPVQSAFTPGSEAITQARRIVDGFEASKKEGRGAFALDGRMIDMPLVKNARKVLDRARAAGKL